MKPLLAHVYEPHRVTYPCFIQPKLNGIRALYQAGRFQSREELPFAEELLAHLSVPLMAVLGNNHAPLDGELYVHTWPLQRINAAVTPVRGKPTLDTLLVQYHVFDVVDPHKSFEERFCRKYLIPTLLVNEGLTRVITVPTALIPNEDEANYCYSRCVTDGFEGMMYRLGDCPYTVPRQETVSLNRHENGAYHCEDGIRPPGRLRTWSDKDNRTWHLLKRKSWQDDDFDFISIRRTYGDKGEPGFIITCKAGPKAKKPTFDVGSGLSRAEVDRLLEDAGGVSKVKVKYLCLSVDGIPLNPTVLAIL